MVLELLTKPLNSSRKLFDSISQNLFIALSILVPLFIIVVPAFIVKRIVETIAKPFENISGVLGEGISTMSSSASSYAFNYIISKNLIFVIIVFALIFGILAVGFNIKKIEIDYKSIWKAMIISGIQIVYYFVIATVLSFLSYYFIIFGIIGIINSIICLYTLLFSPLEISQDSLDNDAYEEIAAQSATFGDEKSNRSIAIENSSESNVNLSEKVKKMSLKQKRVFGAAVIVILFCIAFAFIGSSLTSKNHISKKLIQAIKDNNYNEMSKYIVASDPNLKVDGNNIKAYADYLNANPSYKSEVISAISAQGNGNVNSITSSNSIKLSTMGKKFLFFNNNVYQLQAYFIKVKIPYRNTEVLLDKNKVYTSSKDSEEKECGPYLPGKYKLNFKTKTSYANVENEQEIVIDPRDTNLNEVSVEAKLDGEKVNYPDDCDDAEIFINGKDTNITVKNSDKIIPLPSNGKYSIELKKEFPWGKMKSSKLVLKNGNNADLNFDKNNYELINLIKPVISDFAKSYESANKAFDPSKLNNVTDEYKEYLTSDINNNKASNQAFSGSIKSIVLDPDSLELTKDDDNYNLSVKASFNADLSIGSNKCFNKDSYSINLIYDESQKKWLLTRLDEDFWGKKIENGTEININ